jgi:hypothetical protein
MSVHTRSTARSCMSAHAHHDSRRHWRWVGVLRPAARLQATHARQRQPALLAASGPRCCEPCKPCASLKVLSLVSLLGCAAASADRALFRVRRLHGAGRAQCRGGRAPWKLRYRQLCELKTHTGTRLGPQPPPTPSWRRGQSAAAACRVEACAVGPRTRQWQSTNHRLRHQAVCRPDCPLLTTLSTAAPDRQQAPHRA